MKLKRKKQLDYTAPQLEVFVLSPLNLLNENSIHEGALLGEFEEKGEW